MRLEVLPVEGIGDVRPGDDLAAAITAAAPWLRAGDVLVVTSKIVSKAEGSLVDVPVDGDERAAARDEVLRAETARQVARRGQTRIVQTHHGFVMASAGIDASNIDRAHLVLLPKDPDASARALRTTLRERHGLDVAVVISDTMGRPWRNGLTDVALGAAGIPAIRDHRGEVDPYGNELSITQMAVVDELAAAGELVKGKCAQVPVAVVRGYLDTPLPPADGLGAAVLVRGADQDLFSLGTAEARAEGLRAAARLTVTNQPPFPILDDIDTPKAVARALATIAPVTTATTFDVNSLSVSLTTASPTSEAWPAQPTDLTAPTNVTAAPTELTAPPTELAPLPTDLAAAPTARPAPPAGPTAPPTALTAPTTDLTDPAEALPAAPGSGEAGRYQIVCRPVDSTGGAALIALGIDVQRLRAALAAEGLGSTMETIEDGGHGPRVVVTVG
ncbi:coenzyme F420-0:L-glutamate ligase [Asanoa siamensis]|nr:coenzyme F420-0:L-glutamate ligase [Asanoa siamensis]